MSSSVKLCSPNPATASFAPPLRTDGDSANPSPRKGRKTCGRVAHPRPARGTPSQSLNGEYTRTSPYSARGFQFLEDSSNPKRALARTTAARTSGTGSFVRTLLDTFPTTSADFQPESSCFASRNPFHDKQSAPPFPGGAGRTLRQFLWAALTPDAAAPRPKRARA